MSPKLPVPANGTELEEMLLERDTRLGEVMKAYISEQAELIEAQLHEKMQAGLGDFLKGNPAPGTGAATPAALSGGVAGLPPEAAIEAARLRQANAGLPGAVARSKLFNREALGAPLDGEAYARSIGAFLQAVWHRAEAERPGEIEALRTFRGAMRNALSERVDSQGGFLVPERLRSQVLMVALESAVVRPRARVIQMDSLRVPYPTVDDTSHATSVFGGVIGYWTEEAAALTASQPAFARIVLEAKKLTAYTEIPNELLQDSVAALDQWFNDMFPIAIAWFEDVAFITGSGTGQPQGYLNAPCAVVNTARATASHVRFTDIAQMYSRMLPMSLNSATWVCSPSVVADLLQMAVTEPGGTTVAPPVFLQQFQAQGGPQLSLLGRPVVVTEKHPALGTSGDIAFVDFGYYLLGDRQAMQISSSEHYKFANDLTAFRITERLDGRTWIQSAITPEGSGSPPTLSPVVLSHS